MKTIKRQLNTHIVAHTPSAVTGQYEPVMVRNGIGFVSGQFPIANGKLRYTGRAGTKLNMSEG